MTQWTCSICEHVFEDEVLEDAIQISSNRRRSRLPTMYQFADGSFHFLRKVQTKKSPQPVPASEPKEDTDLLQATLSVLAELPTPPPGEEIKTELPQVTLEEEDEPSLTVMGSAWNRRK